MQQIVNFLIRNKNFLLFLLLLLISLLLTFQSHSYHKSKVVSSTNFLSGGIYSWKNSITDYLSLKDENQRLLKENEQLRNKLVFFELDTVTKLDTNAINKKYIYTKASVTRNDYSKIDNYILINKGKKDSIFPDMGVITDQGIIGIVENTSQNYTRVISILNSNSKINVGLKKTSHYGSLTWDGKNPNIVQLETIPSQAPIKNGDTIITNGRSTIFPKGIGVGTIVDYRLDQSKSYYQIDVKLFNDMTSIGFVYAIRSNDAEEIKALETKNLNE